MHSGSSNGSQDCGVSRSRRSSVRLRRRTGRRSRPCERIPRAGSRTSKRWARSGRWRGRIGRGRWPRRGARRRPHRNEHGQPSSVLVVCATHDDIAQVTAAIRAQRQQAGELGEGVRVDRYVPLHYTLAQKHDPRQFAAARGSLFKVTRLQSCAIDITNGEDVQPEDMLAVEIPSIENLARCALNSSVVMMACRPIRHV
jgi:hypothetical protein